MEREFQRLAWVEIQKLVPNEIDTVLFPVGTIEAHGAAALGTDNYIPESMAAYLAEKINALIAPTVNYGITKSLYGYPGSMTVRPETFKQYIFEILISLKDVGFKRIVILNGHGGNNSALKEAAQEFFRDYHIKIAVIHWWELVVDTSTKFFGERGGHAAQDEASMVQAVDDKLVKKDLYDKEMAYYYRPGGDIYPVPGTILLYKEGEGYPDYDLKKAREFQKVVFAEVEEFIKHILQRWDRI